MSASGQSRVVQDALRDQLTAAALREPDPSRTAQTALCDALLAVAVREQTAAVPVRRRRRRLRTVGVVAFAVLGIAAAAEATRLISVGSPIDLNADRASGDPYVAGLDIVATAPDPERGTTWGVGLHRTAGGQVCALAGELRGRRLGLEEGGRFRPYRNRVPGACADVSQRDVLLLDRLLSRGGPPRSVWFGRTAHPDRLVTISVNGGPPQTAKTGRGGGFLFVFEGVVEPGDLRVFPTEP